MATKDTRPAVMADKRKPIVSRLLPVTPCHHGASPRARHATREMLQIADSARSLVCQPKHTGEDRSSIPALGWCRMIGGLRVGLILSEHHARAA